MCAYVRVCAMHILTPPPFVSLFLTSSQVRGACEYISQVCVVHELVASRLHHLLHLRHTTAKPTKHLHKHKPHAPRAPSTSTAHMHPLSSHSYTVGTNILEVSSITEGDESEVVLLIHPHLQHNRHTNRTFSFSLSLPLPHPENCVGRGALFYLWLQ